MTNRQTIHDGEGFPQMPAPARLMGFNGYDSSRTAAGNRLTAGGGGHA
jgi:hypothetical protein